MAGISSKAAGKLENKRWKFQEQELDDDLGLNWYGFKWRNHDPQIGRFIQIDPLSDKYVYNSTYAFSENKVTSHIELEGLEAISMGYGKNWSPTREQENGIHKGYVEGLKKGAPVVAAVALAPLAWEAWVAFAPEIAAIQGIEVGAFIGAGAGAAATMKSESSGLIQAEANLTEIAASESAGVNITLKGRSNWTPTQNADASAKADALTAAETIVTANPVARQSNLRSKFVKAGNAVSPNQQVDHTVDLQLGGTNAMSNLNAIDASVNMSFGKQINNQIKNLPDATRVNKVIFIPHKPK